MHCYDCHVEDLHHPLQIPLLPRLLEQLSRLLERRGGVFLEELLQGFEVSGVDGSLGAREKGSEGK